MKNLFCIALILLTFSCKKKNDLENDDVTKYTWPLKSATITPAMVVNGKSETNFMTMDGPSGCLSSNFTLNFHKDGSYAFTSNGPLCDMISYRNAKWIRNGKEFKLNDGIIAQTYIYYLNGDTFTNEYSFDQKGTHYTVKYIFVAKKK